MSKITKSEILVVVGAVLLFVGIVGLLSFALHDINNAECSEYSVKQYQEKVVPVKCAEEYQVNP